MKIHYQPVFTLYFPTLQSHMLEVSITSAFALVESLYTNDLLHLSDLLSYKVTELFLTLQ